MSATVKLSNCLRNSGPTRPLASRLLGATASMQAPAFPQGTRTKPAARRPGVLIAFILAIVAFALPSAVQAQTFATLPALSFTMPVGGASPLPQVVTPTSTGASFKYTGTASTATGGNWLSFSTAFGYYGAPTGSGAAVVVTPVASMAAGTYTGSLVFSSTSNNTATITVPVTLTVVAATGAFPANLPGELSYSMAPSGKASPSQSFVINNGGTGSLNWTLSESYSNGSGWLSVSATSGVSGAILVATVNPSALPGAGLVAGTYAAQLAIASPGGTITIPVVAIVGEPVFRQMNPLSFVQVYGGSNPLPQAVTVADNDTTFTFSATAINSTGGSWLNISPTSYGYYGQNTPQTVTVSVAPAINLAVGTYTSEVEVISSDNTQTVAVPVTLTIVPSTVAFFDDLPGALDYSMTTGGDTPPAQSFQVRNAGTGTLSWTLATSTSDGGNWLTASVASGTAPESVTVAVVPANLPGAGQTPGSYTGQLLLQSATGRVTIPIAFVVGGAAFQQVSPITFTKTYAGSNPLPQVFTAASTGAAFKIYASVEDSTGGNWLTISPSNYGYYGQTTPQSITVSATPDPALAAGTYSAAVFVESADGTISMTVPVSLVVAPASEAYFADLPGQLSFSMATDGNAPPPQPIQILNAGTGTLNWTGAANTSDGGNWLSLSASSGTAPSNITARVVPANLPGGGLVAGTFTGQVVLQSPNDIVTIPVTVVVGNTAFRQIDGLNFNMTYGGANPLPQVINAVSTGTNFNIYATVASSTGGNWLSISPSNYGNYGLVTPQTITVNVNAAAQLAVGTYSAEVLIQSTDNTLNITVPVTLTVSAPTAAFFDQLPGQLTFSMLTGGKTPPALPLQIRNAVAGTLSWTGSVTTSDGGNWLALSTTSGTAPSVISASVNFANLPGAGLVAGIYTGQVLLQSATDRVTVPVSFAVGPNGFEQVGGLNFNMTYGGANPLPQVIPVVNAGAGFAITALAFNSTGGNWLQITPSSYGNYGQPCPQLITATVVPPSPLAVGTYTGEVIVSSTDGSLTLTVPVTLTVSSPTAAFFDQLPNQLTFSMITGAKTFASLPFQIRNAGTGTLAWTASISTSDGASWLSLSTASGTAPTTVTASVNPAMLPGAGLVAGIFNGQIVLQSATDRATISVSVTLGPNGFEQINPINFTMTYGGSNPLPQIVPVLSSGAAFNIIATPFTSTGGNWLSISPSSYGNYGASTPQLITATVNPASPLAVGTYTGVIDVISSGGGMWMTVPVTLTVEPSTATFFDALPGELTFSMNAGSVAPQTQVVSVRNAGAGTLAFTASTTTSDGGGWLTLSSTSGAAPYFMNVSINSANLPGSGLIAGFYTGEVLLQTNGDTVTIPVTVNVGPVVFTQNNPISFSKVFNGANPLPQVITLNASGTGTYAQAQVINATGGNWLSIDFAGNYLPRTVTVSANPAITLAAGTYTAEIVATATNSAAQTTVIPVTLIVEPASATFFDTIQGGLTFSGPATGAAIASLPLPIRNAGPGTLDWVATALTTDRGNWLAISPGSGTAPITPTVSINPANLPGKGLVAGIYTGQIMLQSASDLVTIPVSVTLGDPAFNPVAPLSFTMAYQGTNPAPQAVAISSNDVNNSIYLETAAYNSTGGNWLSISTGGGYTTLPITVTASPATPLAPGVYTSEIIGESTTTGEPLLIPVSLTVSRNAVTAEPVFTPIGGTYSTSQVVTISDGNRDSAVYYTTDGTTPTTSSPRYSGPLQVTATQTIKAIAVSPGYLTSSIATAVYTITAPVAAEPAATQTVTIAEATAGVTVYYTIDGTAPTSASTPYTGPVTITGTTTLKFIAIGADFTPSSVRTVIITVQ